jgi:hydrogenase maturation protein HypF
MPLQALRVNVKGIVQGVGFRPLVYQIARRYDLKGEVFNTSGDVTIRLEGSPEHIQAFLHELARNPPPRALIESITTTQMSERPYTDFAITASQLRADEYQLISPDLATCPDCLKDIFDPGGRRYHYPFTNCTNCGPRFTIIEDIPYDRPRTTMKAFTMCPQCQREYDDPLDRRFHAQPNACPDCGPQLQLTNAGGQVLGVADVLAAAAGRLKEGRIVAIKGLGGFLLACDATNEQTVRTLRERKRRPSKPLAVMLPDLAAVAHYCEFDPLARDQAQSGQADDGQAEVEALTSAAAPILLLKLRNNLPKAPRLAPAVAPGLHHLGVMLPYTPLHHILMRECGLPLVMTSGNLSEEPIAQNNSEALQRLGGIADYFIWHNREIAERYDDSVATVEKGRLHLVRRARGYAPNPLRLGYQSKNILACGPELKNTICVVRDNHAFVSQHLGDLENQETLEHFEKTIELYCRLLRIQPQILACDLHPDYLSTVWAQKEARRLNLPLLQVQHHHAHIVSCLAENNVRGPAIGVALDGTGYGLDGHIWGGEFMLADYRSFQRRAHLEYLPLPGGHLAIRKPYRIAVGYLYQLLGAAALSSDLAFLQGIEEIELDAIKTQVDRHFNTPLTSSCGRLFDAVSALLGVCRQADYEGQAAIELEAMADGCQDQAEYPFRCEQQAGQTIIKLDVLFAALLEDLRHNLPKAVMAARFHNSVLSIMMRIVTPMAAENGVKQVALSGGVFQNRRISWGAQERLQAAGLQPLVHTQLPVNDGCISLGQAVAAHFMT